MFKKLISNLPFNPSLIGQLSFYTKRLHRESVIRRSGLIMLSLALTMQVFAVISPPQPTLARSNNDLVVGGFTTKDEGVGYCKQNTRSYKTILAYYGISCDDMAKATTTTIKSTDNNKRLYSMGHLAYGKAGETPVSIPGAGTVYLRYLWSWDTHGASSYKVLKGTTASGQTFFILYGCGNVTFIGLPTPPKRCAWNAELGADDVKCVEPCPVQSKTNLPKNSAKCFVPCKYDSTISDTSSACKPCEASQTQSDLTACLEYSKTASNTTQKIMDANGTTAKPGDTILYTLRTHNSGKTTIKDYSVNENISDILDYADVVSLNGGTKNDDQIVSWPAKNIGAGETLTQTFTVRIKNPLPNTPISSSDPGHYDNTMTNVYGNTVTIKLPPSIVKSTEIATTTLPNTGPGTSLTIVFVITALAAYLFARTRLMSKELDLVRSDFAQTGGN
jgi:uncharacterized repeat protein (TIGR01451 family)